MNDFIELIKNTKSVYDLTQETIISDQELIEIIENVLLNMPISNFNTQSSRVVVLLAKKNIQFWNIVEEQLKTMKNLKDIKKIQEKLEKSSKSYGTILFYEDQAINQSLQKKYPEYKNLNLTWLEHSNAMLQFSIWCAIETQGLGANIQHYNFIIEEEVKEAFQIPENWKLIAQMPFGKIANMPEEEEKIDLNKRIIVIKE